MALLVRELAVHGVSQTVVGRRGRPLLENVGRHPGLRTLAAGGRLAAFLRMARRPRQAVIHAHTGNTVPLALMARRRGDAVVVTRRMSLPASPFLLEQADRVVAISRGVEEVLLASGLDRALVVRIPSAVDTSRRLDPGLRGPLRARLGVPDAAPLGLTVAALAAEKDPFTLVAALGRLPTSYHHVWVGEGPMRPELERRIAAGGLAARFHLTGFDDDPDRWFAAADFFVLPSRHEGLGSTLLDAFHFGLPVVGTRIAGTAELLTDGGTALLFDPGDAAGLADAAGRVLTENRLAENLREGGRKLLAGYDIRRTAASYLELYRQVLTEAAAGL